MARIRSVHPDICQSETMASLTAEQERCFVRLWTHCDDHGRCKDTPVIIAAAIFTAHEDITSHVVDGWLCALEDAELITRYDVDGIRLIQVNGWDEYQHPQRPKKSVFPPVPDMYATGTRRIADESRREGRGEGGERERNTPSSTDVDGSPDPFAEFWEACPRKVGKAAAERKFNRAIRDVDPTVLVAAMQAHAERWETDRTDPRFIPHPATWLHQGRWGDELVPSDTGPLEFAPSRIMLANQRRASGEACSDCGDTGFVEDAGEAWPCPTCAVAL